MNRRLRTTFFAVLLLSSAAARAEEPSAAAGGRHEIRRAARLPEGEGERYRAFLEAGGVLVVPLVECKEDFAGAAAFCGEDAMPAFRPQKGAANAYDRNVEPGDTPLFDWPNRISETLGAGNGRLSLPGEAGKRWETAGRPSSTNRRTRATFRPASSDTSPRRRGRCSCCGSRPARTRVRGV